MPKEKPEKFTYKSQRRAKESVWESKASKPGRKIPKAVYDDEARSDYLTGFSKRKKAKKEAARLRNEAKAREERNELRKQLRDARKKQAEENVQMAAEFYGDPSLEEQGLSENEEPEVAQDVYETEEGVAVVTVEALDMDAAAEEETPRERVKRDQPRGTRGMGGNSKWKQQAWQVNAEPSSRRWQIKQRRTEA